MDRIRLFRVVLLISSLIYLLVLVKYLILDRMFYSGFGERVANFRPFQSIWQYIVLREQYHLDTWVMNLFGNLAMLFPFGLLLPLLVPSMRRLLQFVYTLLICNLSIEVLQYITNFGSFDIDDIILNCSGGLIGYGCARLFLLFPSTGSE